MDGDLCFSATTRQANVQGLCQIVSGRLAGAKVVEWKVLDPLRSPQRHEKNWIPIVDDSSRFIYSCDPIRVWCSSGLQEIGSPPISARRWRGSSQAIPFDGGFLTIIHETPPEKVAADKRTIPLRYRFVWFDKDLRIQKLSRSWDFGHGHEYVCGMCEHPDGDRLVISYGVFDREAWLATMPKDEARAMLALA